MVFRPAKTAAVLVLVVASSSGDPVEPPDIRSQTLQEYSALGDFPAEMQIRRSVYLDSLESELQRLYLAVDSILAGTPEMRERFRDAHGHFLSWVDGWSWFLEDIQWYDPCTGEQVFGSVYGDTRIQVAAALYWERILFYRAFADGGLYGGFEETTVPSDRIGGY